MNGERDGAAALAGETPLIDVHAHFYYPGCGRANWKELNDAALSAAASASASRFHVASILGSWGSRSPTYFQSPDDTVRGNDAMLALQRAAPERVRMYVGGESQRQPRALVLRSGALFRR